jgi:AraC-like DNA-binding protein
MTIMYQKYTTNRERPFIIKSGTGADCPYHWHDEIEILYLLEGSMTFIIGPKAYKVYERDIIIVKSGEIHRFESQENCKKLLIEFGHYLDTDLFKTPLLLYPGIPSVLRSQPKSIEKEDNQDLKHLHLGIEKLMLDMLKEYEQKDDAWEFLIKAYTYQIVTLLIRAFSDSVKIQLDYKNITRGYTELLQKVFDYIEDHYFENITVEDISEISNFSKHYFNKFFKKVTNKTFTKYVNDVRLEKARAFLKSSNQSITAIAYDVGFNSVRTFNRLFKEQMGCTPRQYREKGGV